MSAKDEAIRLFGTAAPPAPFRILRAGLLEARLEAGNLRYIRYDGHEVLRAVSYIVRDRDWGTLTPVIADLQVEEDGDSFRVVYRGSCNSGDACLTYHVGIEGWADGRLSFSVEATADLDFETNRCGFSVLHPIDGVAGAPVAVEHCDGSVEKTHFPDLIEPWQPFKSIRALTHSPAPHLSATCRMEGDVFEMEDQRNWSDASYKTYVRPLELPWPYSMPAGEANRQAVEVNIVANREETGARARSLQSDTSVHVELGGVLDTRFPRIGLVVAPDEIPAALRYAKRLGEIAPQAILCHFDPAAGHGESALAGFAALQRAFPARYELEYVVACAGELDAEFEILAGQLRSTGFEPASIAVCPSVDRQSTPPGSEWPDCPPLEAIYAAARRAFPHMPLGGGMFSYFTELNRKRPPVELLDFVTHATNPNVHAADDESVMETLETLPHITRSTRAIIGRDRTYRLGPCTIGMRQNPYGSRTFDNPHGERVCMANDDPRQRGRFAAAWTVGYAARIAPAGIERWVPAAFTGPRGVLNEADGSLLPVGEAIASLAGFAHARLIECRASDDRRLAAIAVATKNGPAVLATNLTDRKLKVEFNRPIELEAFQTRRI
ncbi:D-apionate lactonase [Mesorhizobium xinjiangense]|uniref:D-apionate lactonase n=1 Tax=Mesorhizobium xinjiangense TaxID=2678685 RepID=UPI0012ED9DA2|nr:hypothetical protein [Mesorhizobium xinjiangense]